MLCACGAMYACVYIYVYMHVYIMKKRFHGEAVVSACIRNSCDYVDITGEPEFIEKYKKVRIFDEI